MKKQYNIVVLPGDGIGPEVVQHSIGLYEIVSHFLGINFDLSVIPCGGKYYLEHQQEWPEDAFSKCQQADAILLGAVGHVVNGQPVMTAINKPYPQPQLAGYAAVIGNRQKLDLYANVRPIKLLPGIKHKISNRFIQAWYPELVDYVIVRENTEDAYTGQFQQYQDEVITFLKISRQATEKIARFAYRLAKKRAKQLKVTCVDKSNIIEAHRFFRQLFTEIGKQEFPEIQQDYAYADAFCQAQLQQPELYDVVVAPNLIGDIISDNGAITQGGLGMAASANIGDDHAMFEPIHGSAPQLAGLDKANPIATMLSLSMMLEWLGEKDQCNDLKTAATYIEMAVKKVIERGILTEDVIEQTHSSKCSLVATAIKKLVSNYFAKPELIGKV